MPTTVILSNTQMEQAVNDAYAMSVKEVPEGGLQTLTLTNISDIGSDTIGPIKEQFTKSLMSVLVKYWYTQTADEEEYIDPYFVDSEEFGLIIETITVEVPEVQSNSAWINFQSGNTKIGQYTVWLPVVDTKYYTKTGSWALPITISWEQWKEAFHSGSEMKRFINYIMMCVDKAMRKHRKNMSMANRNNAMAQRLANKSNLTSVDFTKEYCIENGITKMSAEEARNSKECLLYSIGRFNTLCKFMGEETELFNIEGKVMHTPKNRLVVELLTGFIEKVETIARSSTYHAELVKLPTYREVPFWQFCGATDFDTCSTIKIKNGDIDIEQSNIVGFIADKWGVMHTIKSQRVGSQDFNIENVTHYEFQNVDQYMNDLSQNGIVCYFGDYDTTESEHEE